MKKNLYIIFGILFQTALLTGQKVYDDLDPIVSFGFQIGGIFPSDLLSVRPSETISDDILYGLEPINGFSYGGVVNFRMSKRFYLLSGINLLRRDYYGFRDLNGMRDRVRFRTTTYEIPIMASYYIRLTDYWLLNVSSGVPFHFLPTDLYARTDDIEILSLKLGVIKPVSSTTVGLEFRSGEYGSFYIGAVYNFAPWPLFISRVSRRGAPETEGGILEQVGDFFGVQFRYYLE